MKTKIIVIGLITFVVETLLFELWIYLSKPTPDISIALIVIIPFIFGGSILIGLFILWIKIRHLAKIAFLNAVVGPTIFYFYGQCGLRVGVKGTTTCIHSILTLLSLKYLFQKQVITFQFLMGQINQTVRQRDFSSDNIKSRATP